MQSFVCHTYCNTALWWLLSTSRSIEYVLTKWDIVSCLYLNYELIEQNWQLVWIVILLWKKGCPSLMKKWRKSIWITSSPIFLERLSPKYVHHQIESHHVHWYNACTTTAFDIIKHTREDTQFIYLAWLKVEIECNNQHQYQHILYSNYLVSIL